MLRKIVKCACVFHLLEGFLKLWSWNLLPITGLRTFYTTTHKMSFCRKEGRFAYNVVTLQFWSLHYSHYFVRLPEVSALFGFDPQRFRPLSGSALEVSAPIYENVIFGPVSFCIRFILVSPTVATGNPFPNHLWSKSRTMYGDKTRNTSPTWTLVDI